MRFFKYLLQIGGEEGLKLWRGFVLAPNIKIYWKVFSQNFQHSNN
jgi:hypothetical protein